MCVLVLLSALVLCGCAQYSSDQCSWTGSGLTHESRVRDVEQVYLRCAEGSLEWLYPTGAVIVNLRPNLPSSAHLHACVKPRPHSRGATLYVERAGELRLLLSEAEQVAGLVRCFGLQEGALFVEASAPPDISRRITAFQYQLISTQTSGHELYSPAACRPCADDELLMSICSSDFAVRGHIHHVEEDEGQDEGQVSVLVSVSRVYRQKSRVFGGRGRGRWTGRVKVPRRCGPRAGRVELLLTGAVRFGEAWLACAPLYKDFLRLYGAARDAGTNPCHIHTD